MFGTELRRRRVAAGLSLAAFARLVHYSKSHLSKVETGAKAPSPDLARRCDSALDCGGELAGLVPVAETRGTAEQTITETDRGEVWLLTLDDMGTNGFRPVSRREVLAAGGAAGLGLGMAGFGYVPSGPPGTPGPSPAHGADGGREAVTAFRAVFDQLRHQGQRWAPGLVVPTLVAQTHALRTLAAQAGGRDRAEALTLAARFAEYTGWMVQEQGDDALAAWWTDRAVDFAEAGGDRDMAAYALVRRGLIALYRYDGRLVVELARQAQAGTGDPRIRGLAAQREAQGLAVTGDYDGCLRALDRAAELLSRAAAENPAGAPARATGTGGTTGGATTPSDLNAAPTIGSAHVPDPVAVATGWCLFDLGRPRQAADVLHRELARIPADAHRARARFGARLALALAGCGEPEQACAVAEEVLDACGRLQSATVRVDLRGLSRDLNRWPGHPAVRRTRTRLTEVLRA
ncbi:helix-turn-helix transcriptional regulator [Catenulispora subtropica]|uniref:HTH cro/C1-type domain-containing protein n=1 Tax=Catenulispora subtropica TaxID=450798 RepID=A0ABN2T2S5_9ACTN